MTKKDRQIIGIIIISLALLLGLIIKNGGNQIPMPNDPKNQSLEIPGPEQGDQTT